MEEKIVLTDKEEDEKEEKEEEKEERDEIYRRAVINFYKEFASGDQNQTINLSNGVVSILEKKYYWQEQLVYNKIGPMVESFKAKNKDVSDEALYGINGLVSQLYPYQLQYNKLQNGQAEFVDRMLTPVLVVEDGSVDTNDLEEDGLAPGKILVYRNGAKEPKLLYPEINEKFIQNIWTTYDELLNAMHDVYSNFCNDYERGVYNETIN